MVRSCVGGLGLFCATYNSGGIRCLLQSGEYEPIIGAKLGMNSTRIREELGAGKGRVSHRSPRGRNQKHCEAVPEIR